MRRIALIALVLVGLNATPTGAQLFRGPEPVDVLLILAVDSSASVDSREYWIQMTGIANAMKDPEILTAIEAGYDGAVAISVIEWSSAGAVEVAIPWERIHDAATAQRFSDRVSRLDRYILSGRTSISGIVDYAREYFPESPYEGTRRVLDVSGDGENNDGLYLSSARRRAIEDGFWINGLAILTDVPDLDVYFRENLIAGPLAFVEVADTYDDYPAAILRKLLRELSTTPISWLTHVQ